MSREKKNVNIVELGNELIYEYDPNTRVCIKKVVARLNGRKKRMYIVYREDTLVGIFKTYEMAIEVYLKEISGERQ